MSLEALKVAMLDGGAWPAGGAANQQLTPALGSQLPVLPATRICTSSLPSVTCSGTVQLNSTQFTGGDYGWTGHLINNSQKCRVLSCVLLQWRLAAAAKREGGVTFLALELLNC